MSGCRHAQQMARYNQWMNQRLYQACGRLDAEAFTAARGAFFSSLCGTLNHIAVADTVWLRRFTCHPAQFDALAPVHELPRPVALDQVLHADLPTLGAYREQLDRIILDLADSLREDDLDAVLEYQSMKGIAGRKRFGDVLLHFFNHQTHHRGQATTLLAQSGQDMGATDLLVILPDAE